MPLAVAQKDEWKQMKLAAVVGTLEICNKKIEE